MTAVFKRIIPTVALAAALATATVFAGFGAAPKIGDKARPFTLTALDGKSVSLAGETARGPVVLVLARGWPGYQCPFCTRQFADFVAHAKEFETLGASVVWVYPGPSDQVVQRANIRQVCAGHRPGRRRGHNRRGRPHHDIGHEDQGDEHHAE